MRRRRGKSAGQRAAGGRIGWSADVPAEMSAAGVRTNKCKWLVINAHANTRHSRRSATSDSNDNHLARSVSSRTIAPRSSPRQVRSKVRAAAVPGLS